MTNEEEDYTIDTLALIIFITGASIGAIITTIAAIIIFLTIN